MSVKEFIAKIAATLGKSVDKIAKAVMNANLVGLIRFGIVIGVGVVTVIAIYKFLKMKKHVYTDNTNKDVVDEGLDLNYADVRNQKELHPLMKKVRRNLNKELKPRKKKSASKKVRKDKKKYQDFMKDLDVSKYSFDEDYDVMEDFEMFRREMKDVDMKRKRDRKRTRTVEDYNLRNVWENC